jgi:hypothetical protein
MSGQIVLVRSATCLRESIMKLLSQILIPVLLAICAHAQPTVRFCDLLRNPDEYNGKTVVVRATYRYGFEWQELFCLGCLDKGEAWLELPSDLDDASVKALKRGPKGAGIVNLTVQGIFLSGAYFWHLGTYRFKFVVQRVSDVVIVSKGMKSAAEERRAEQKCACGGTHPK